MEKILAKEKDLGGFKVRRLLPSRDIKTAGPWIFFDHMGPANFKPGEGINVRPHPHINLATVTYLFEGEILHRDSLGSNQLIRPGDINLMIAGKGITHSEREREEIKNSNHTQHGLQLWHALPEEFEEIDPEFHHYSKNEIPLIEMECGNVRVMMGKAFGAKSPVKTFSKTIYIEANINSGKTLEIPSAEESAIYVLKGSISIKGINLTQYEMLHFVRGEVTEMKANSDAKIVMIGGDKLGQRYIDWNFVSSSKERIEKAKKDWKEGKFPKVPGDESEFIPLP